MYLHDAHQEPVVAVAVGTDGDGELHAIVEIVGIGLAQVPGHAAGTQVGAADGGVDGLLLRQHAHALRAGQDDLVLRNQSLELRNGRRGGVEQVAQRGPELRRRLLVHAPGAHVAHGDPRAAQHLEQVEDALPLAEAVHERRAHGAEVLQEEADAHQVAGDALQLRRQHAQVHAALGDFDAGELLDGHHVRLVVDHGGGVVEPVRQRHDLRVRALLGQLLRAAVQVAEDGLHVRDDLAVQRHPQPEHAVGARVLGAKVYRYLL